MDRVIASLQRERWFALQNIAHFEQALAERKAEAEELERAIVALGGNGNPSACKEAEEAYRQKVEAAGPEEGPAVLGAIAGRW